LPLSPAFSKRIVFATFGSLGDLHPYLSLALELKRRGHRPVIATFDGYREAVAATGAEFAPMRPAMAEFGEPATAMRRLLDPDKGPEYLVRHLFMPHIRASYEDLDCIAADADVIVSHPIAFAAPLVAQKRGLAWASSVLAPLSLMSAIDPPLFGPAPWLRSIRKFGVAPYRLVFRLVKRIAGAWEQPLRALRAELGIPSDRLAQFEGQYSPALNLALFSRVLAVPQTDWPPNTVVCGFPHYDGTAPDGNTRAALDAFIASGERPLVFGLGSSAIMIAGEFWNHAIAAAQRLGRRAILVTGNASERFADLPSTVEAFPYFPYSAVFPHAAAVVHSGGIGTLAQALAAGHPQLVVPVAFDQFDNAARALRLGCARTLRFSKVTADTLAREIDALLASPQYATQAERIGEDITRENGAHAACDAIESLLRDAAAPRTAQTGIGWPLPSVIQPRTMR
jgi:rhamnosyltransferase subunit B